MALARTASAKKTGRGNRSTGKPSRARPKASAGKSRRAKAKKTRNRILPPELAAAIERRIVQFFGLFFILITFATALALLTYNPSDPSWNNATTAAPQNWMGLIGSHAADLILQSVGLSAFCVVAALFVWGIRLLLGRILEALLWRLILLPAVLILAAIALSALFPAAQWPVRSGAGGLIGSTLFGAVNELGGAMGNGLKGWTIGLFASGLALLFFLPVLGLTLREWGWVGRALTWPVVILGRLFQRQGDKQANRIEPRVTITRENSPAPNDKIFEDAVDITAPLPEAEKAPATVSRANPAERKAEKAAKKHSRRLSKKSPAKAEKPPLIRRGRTKKTPDAVAPESRPAVIKEHPAKSRTGQRAKAARQPSLDLDPGAYKFPPLTLLQDTPLGARTRLDDDALEQDARLLESVLADFGVKGQIVKVRPGPVVTLFELEPAPGIKASRIIGLADDIARSMSAISVRVAVVPGRNVIGIEKPNQTREMVLLRELLSTRLYEKTSHSLALVLGKDIGGAPIIADLARMPHLLIAGTTGSGKSVGINTMILSLLFRLTPDQCKFIMIDPKMLELSVYDGIPQLLTPVVTDPKKAVVALRWAVREMETRYKAMSKLGVRNIDGYNQRLVEARKKGEVLTQKVPTGLDEKGRPIMEDQPIPLDPLPFIVVIVDEMADLMLVAGKEIETAVQRLAQMARAAGIHLIMATQRPSVDVITGTIKANFPTRISFQVTTKIDSRTILGEQGAEQLLGQGDMLHMAGGGRITRVHGPFVSDEEVEKIVQHLKSQGEPAYIDKITEDDEANGLPTLAGNDGGGDELYQKAVEIVLQEEKCSTSFIQRRLQIGYNRAARLVERMEEEGIVSPANHAGKREILAGRH